MPDSKITALTALTAADPANDMFPIVDVSDTSMAASGTTKRISINNLLAASGTATLASATITGDLTVDTSTLKVDSANDRVGIKTATPLYPLHLVGEFGLEEASPAGTGSKLRFIGDATKYNFRIGKQLNVNNGFEITPSTALGGTTFSNPVYTVTYDGIHTFLDGAGGTRMTLNSTGLGVGASPAATIHGYSASGSAQLRMQNGTAVTGRTWYFNSFSDGNLYIGIPTVIDALTVTPSGNVGIGVTPSAWFSSRRAVSFGGGSSLSGYIGSPGTELWTNTYLNAAGNAIYVYSNYEASRFYSAGGAFVWENAPNSGASGAGTAATLTPRMTLDASGNLILLSSNTPATLTTNGQLTVNATSNTNLRFSYRGSDGVTRTANLTLA